MNSFYLTKLGAIMAGGGVIWAVYSATKGTEISAQFAEHSLRNVFMQTGPLEVCGIGVLIWIIGKWRSSVSG